MVRGNLNTDATHSRSWRLRFAPSGLDALGSPHIGRAGSPACLLQRSAQHVLNLTVQAAQFIVRPTLEAVEDVTIDPKQERLPFGHGTLPINGSRIDNGLSTPFTTEHDQQVAHHCCLAFVVERHDFPPRQHLQGHLHHPDGAFDDPLARRNDGTCLLPLQHGGGNFRRVGEMTDPGFDDFDTGLRQPILNLTFQVFRNHIGVPARRSSRPGGG
jgi:hypothetical protein